MSELGLKLVSRSLCYRATTFGNLDILLVILRVLLPGYFCGRCFGKGVKGKFYIGHIITQAFFF